jgi:hypothetical protein
MPAQNPLKEQFAKLGFRGGLFSGSVVGLAIEKLDPNAVIHAAVEGVYYEAGQPRGMSILSALNESLVLVGTRGRNTFVEHYPYNKIGSVRFADDRSLFLQAPSVVVTGSGVDVTLSSVDRTKAQFFVDTVTRLMTMPSKESTEQGNEDGKDLVSQLERLARLREQGILTEAEFQKMKRKIVDG